MSKGSTQRPTDKDKFDENFDKIFKKSKAIKEDMEWLALKEAERKRGCFDRLKLGQFEYWAKESEWLALEVRKYPGLEVKW